LSRDVLIIEDEAIIALDIARMVKINGYIVAGVAADAGQALAMAEKKPPSLALVDIKLKGNIDGIEVARMLKERFSIPVVFITAYSDESVRARAMLVHPAGYLIKPINKLEFEKILKTLLPL